MRDLIDSKKELRMSLLAWCRWLEQTPLATAISESIWLFPLIEGSHILAVESRLAQPAHLPDR
jgi:hypothetical protein